jgi:hypothetical protein
MIRISVGVLLLLVVGRLVVGGVEQQLVPALASRGHILVISANEIGNILCRFMVGVAVRFREGRGYRPLFLLWPPGRVFNRLVTDCMPREFFFNPRNPVHRKMEHDLLALPDGVVTVKNEYDEWQEATVSILD